jgi:hypothetical protein
MSTYPSTNPKKRDAAIKVMLTPGLRADLDLVAEAIGQTPSTAAAFAIGQWVAQHKRAMSATETALQSLMQSVGPEMVEQMRQIGGKA